MAVLLDIEDVLGDVKTALVNGLPAKIAAINAAATDGVVLADIATGSWWTHVPQITLGRGDFDVPAIAIIDEGVQPEPDFNVDFYTMRYSIIVDVIVRGESAEDVSKRVRRYTKALCAVLLPRGSALNGSGRVCIYGGSSTHRVTDPDSGDLLQDMASRFYLIQGEATA